LQSDGKKVAHAGLKSKTKPVPKVLNGNTTNLWLAWGDICTNSTSFNFLSCKLGTNSAKFHIAKIIINESNETDSKAIAKH